MNFQGKRILLGVSGSIAAYKAAELARKLVAAGAEVRVVMTRAAQELVGPITFQALTGQKVGAGLWGGESEPLEHITLGQETDAIVLAPATANLLGKMAAGIGDDLLTTILLAATKPVLVCPAMNTEMWRNAAVQENLARLKARGLQVMEPDAGELACGAVGPGRLPDSLIILEALAALVTAQDLAGRRLLVTAGPTHEDLDPVRFLTNRSSGKMGYALARVGRRRGAEVCLVSGPTALDHPYGVERVMVWSAVEMRDAVTARFPETDALLMAAAVGDYRPDNTQPLKIKRGRQDLELRLVQNPDILKEIRGSKNKQVVVGFAAETHDMEAEARRKMADKGLDLIVANDVTRRDAGFAVDTNEVTVIHRDGRLERLPLL
ncbi:MAG: bifunctional phosphopantothenoylcysteine decarboxylase/phosphopantothenate--cysteine ligase CoaBC, partial [Deltaproteobacteria bacterium]|nr:bifunctional phosphopantothenoylcysteine decarboxylase/phosphopantothenate--cysteine ligase CoaBC [Deltaproteobacteria bacterium]